MAKEIWHRRRADRKATVAWASFGLGCHHRVSLSSDDASCAYISTLPSSVRVIMDRRAAPLKSSDGRCGRRLVCYDKKLPAMVDKHQEFTISCPYVKEPTANCLLEA